MSTALLVPAWWCGLRPVQLRDIVSIWLAFASTSARGRPSSEQQDPVSNNTAVPAKPNAWQYLRYIYGGRLPDSMRDWVRNDLAGKGATRRMMVRMFIPACFVMLPFWFIPTTLDVHLSMTLPILIPFVYFSHALNKVWRRHMLRVHGLDPSLVDEISRKKNAHIHQAYIARHGPRSGPSSSHDI